MDKGKLQEYWRKNLTIVSLLLAIWFLFGYVLSIFLADTLDAMGPVLGGFKLGFWFSQQGSEILFVILIFVYVWLMNRLDREYDVHEE